MPASPGARRSIVLSLAMVAAGIAAAACHFPRQQAHAAQAQQRARLAQAGRLEVIEHGVAAIDGLAVDAGGRLMVSETGHSSVHAIDSAGKREQFAGQGSLESPPPADSSMQLLFPSALAADASGNVYVADKSNDNIGCILGSRIRKIAADGTVSRLAHADAALDKGNGQPDVTALAVAPAGDLYVQDSESTYKLSRTGKRSVLPVPDAPHQIAHDELALNRGLAAHPDGGVVVANTRYGVYRILADDRAVPLASHGADCWLGASNATGVAHQRRACMIDALVVDAHGRIFLWEGGRILRIDAGGAVSTVFDPVDARPMPSTPPSTQYERGLMALGARGEIYLAHEMTLYKVTPWSRLRPQ